MKHTRIMLPALGLGLGLLVSTACGVEELDDSRELANLPDDLEVEGLEQEELDEPEPGPQRAQPDEPQGEEFELTNPQDPSEVVYGNPTSTCEWPATVAMIGASGNINCTGSLVHPELVIYAAHCGANYPQVYFGETTTSPARSVATSSCETFSGFTGFGDGDDFAFCRLATPVTDVPIIPPLMGSETNILQQGQAVTLVGFGFDEFGNIGTKREANTIINEITPTNEAFVGGTPQDTCQGDSGGPVYVQLADGSWRVFGITSYGGACGTGGFYSMMHIGMEWFEDESGLDLTPCHTASGLSHFGSPNCGYDVPTTPGNGAWATGCSAGSSGSTCCDGQPFPSPGCSDTVVQDCVCATDSYCCDTSWDSICANEVESLGCGMCPEARPNSCCETGSGPGCSNPAIETQVCAADPYCCNTRWDSICVSEVESFGIGQCDSTCCEPQIFPSPGCDDAGVQACVCAADPFCCSTSWDSICANEVESLGCSLCG
ncbi:MAG: S1 family peptidase [Myxococcota bacterium]